MEAINDILKDFKKISLSDINPVKLMNRTDTKFAFSIYDLPVFLKQLSPYYKVLSIANNSNLSYRTLYYDTANFTMYMRHHNGVLNRYKIRHRTYLQSNTGFLEIKFKNNKGRTIKERITQNVIKTSWSGDENNFISSNTPYDPHLLAPSVLVNYTRITLINTTVNEKVTIDVDLEFSNKLTSYKLNNLVIAEVKQATKTKTPVLTILKELNIKPVSFSKYCLGVNYLYPKLKKNNFKQKLVTLNKIINDTALSHTTSI